MDFQKEKDKIIQLQRCQRNWDYSKSISDEHTDHFLWLAINTPSKQWQAYYDVYYIKNRDTIKEFYQWTWGSTHTRKPPSTWRNPQMNASLYILFVAKHTTPMRNCYNDGRYAKVTDQHIWDNAYTHIGLAMGLVSKAAVDLGYCTGYNKSNGMGPDYDYQWERKMGIYDDVIKGTKKLTFGVGIGHPQKNRARNEHDDYELSIGAANAHNMTLYKEGRDPIKNHLWRKTKIVDVRKTKDKEVDPYGNIHTIPKVPYIKIQSHLFREIKCIEVKK